MRMEASASILTEQFTQLLARLAAGLDLDRLAAERGTLLWLALARGPGGLSLRETAAWAGLVDLAKLSNPADFIVRLRWNALRLRQADARRFDPIAALGALPAADAPQEGVVQAEPGRHQAALPRRPILPRKPAAAATATRRALLRHASRKQKKLDPRTLVAAEFMILATSLPAEHYPADQVLPAYRPRGQIKLAFQRLTSLPHIDQLPTLTPAGSI